jgi:DNA-binding SARP family transcriptional activator
MFLADTAVSAVAQARPTTDAMTPRQRLTQLERWGEEAYMRMYDARSPSGDYSDAKDNFHAAIALANELGLKDEAARLEQRLLHIKSVFRTQFG